MDVAINYWAVLVAAIVNMAVGSIWYGPVFGKMWMSLTGLTKDSMKSMPLSVAQAMGLGLVTALLMSYVLAYFAFVYGAVGASEALTLALLVWLGFFVTNTAGGFIWEGRPFKLFLLNAAQQLVSLGLMALVLVLWQ